MEEKEDFGCCLALPELTRDNLAQSLRNGISNSKKNIVISSFGVISGVIGLPYVRERCYEVFPEPWGNTIYNGMALLGILAGAAGVYSAYTWWQNSKRLSELEEKLE